MGEKSSRFENPENEAKSAAVCRLARDTGKTQSFDPSGLLSARISGSLWEMLFRSLGKRIALEGALPRVCKLGREVSIHPLNPFSEGYKDF